MVSQMKSYCFLVIALAGILSCGRENRPIQQEEPEKPAEQPKQREEALSFQQELSLVQLIPELESNPLITEDKNQDFFLSLGTQSCDETFQVGPLYLPAQVSEPVFLNADQSVSGTRAWTLRSTGFLVISLILPEGCEELESADCQAAFRLHFSLDENAPYRKVSLSRISVQFPDWLRATPVGGSIPNMELTKEGTDVEFNLTALYGAEHFVDAEGKYCLSAETTFSASVSAAAEDALDPSAETPASVRLRCAFESGRIDFSNGYLIFTELEFPRKEMKGEPVPLPSFLSGVGSEIIVDGPQVLVRYSEDLPFTNTVEATFPDLPNRSPFYLHSSGEYLLMPRYDGWDRGEIINTEIPALREIFRQPASDGTLTPRMTVRPVVEGSDAFATPFVGMVVVPGKEYHMALEAEWSLPLAFSGTMTGISGRTETLRLDGDELDAPGAGTHEIGMTLMSELPFDCLATPVFTLEGSDPVFLDDIKVEGYRGGPWFHHAFTPGKDHWKASLYFIITPTNILSTQFRRNQSLVLKDALFTANLSK